MSAAEGGKAVAGRVAIRSSPKTPASSLRVTSKSTAGTPNSAAARAPRDSQGMETVTTTASRIETFPETPVPPRPPTRPLTERACRPRPGSSPPPAGERHDPNEPVGPVRCAAAGNGV
ncbi:hypothetical protein GCM10010140_03990 [Streptosporangium pseudovulgare]|uniref:Uncharacterized protein n=1 Tax=Streptosporangium pseudovulgare TaxID=35765 RepID=A0ABQ2QH34_9ACTN|nr:hypothetical protein GCM10010140_03990 [Streptosporangium pseudovulgare]